MGFIMNFLGSGIIKMFGNSILGPILDRLNKKTDSELEHFKTAVGAERDVLIANLQASIAANESRAQLLAIQWGRPEIRIIIMMTALPCCLHFGAVMLDSLPWFGHVVGSWRVPKLPSPYDTYQWIVLQSFFILAPVQVGVGAFARWLHK